MRTKDECIGDIFKTNEGYDIQIISYIDRHNVLIKFVERPSYQVWSTMQNIKKGQIKNPYHPSVYGLGFYGVGNYTARINNKKTEQYIKWFSMFVRCYDEGYQERQPTYIGCSVSDEFMDFQNFAQWYDRAIYDCEYPLELDKDLMIEGNKVYSPMSCCFIPKEINNALRSKRNDVVYMTKIYNKYNHCLPQYIKEKLFALTNRKRFKKQSM